MKNLPETVLQFGTGRFMRAFADWYIHQANQGPKPVGRVVLVQSTGESRANDLTRLGGAYHLLIRGMLEGRIFESVEKCESVSRALVASTHWNAVLEFAASDDLRVILSNTTEKGYDLDDRDSPKDFPPKSFPTKLLQVLHHRYLSGKGPVTVIPCELRENQADVLRDILTNLSTRWRYSDDYISWMRDNCLWLNNLVDRIVTGTPEFHHLLSQDPMLIACEPYGLWAIQEKPGVDRFIVHPSVIWTPDVTPFFLRKVRILNGGHTALLIKAWPLGFRTVREAVNDSYVGPWLENLLLNEIAPVLEGRVENPTAFAHEVLDRFRNPFIDHKLSDIALHHPTKVEVRLVPSMLEYQEKFGTEPTLLSEVLKMP
ncbi:MAG: altronate dehydrogenase, partial [Gemmataceae bacterium]